MTRRHRRMVIMATAVFLWSCDNGSLPVAPVVSRPAVQPSFQTVTQPTPTPRVSAPATPSVRISRAPVLAGPNSATPSPKLSTFPTASPPADGAVSFKTTISPMLTQTCGGCHSPGYEGNRQLSLFVNGKVDYTATSKRIANIISECESGNMPLGRPQLTEDQISAMKAWKTAGSPNN